MRKLLVILLFIASFSAARAQNDSWNFSVQGGFGWGGPKSTFRSAMTEANFNQTHAGWLGTNTKYPRVYPSFSLLLKGGKQIKPNTGVFVMAGLAGIGTVEGYNQENFGSTAWLNLSGGTFVGVAYRVLQITTGLQHRLPRTSATIGYGPSVYVMQYNNSHFPQEKERALVPGLYIGGTLPLGKQKQAIGLALVTDINLAPRASVEPLHHYYTEGGEEKKIAFVRKVKAGMTQGSIGLALTLRS